MLDPDRRHLIAYLAAAAVLVVIGVRYIGHGRTDAPLPTVSTAAPAAARITNAPAGGERPRAAAASAGRAIWVDVAGAVRRPGLYSLPEGARVAAAIERAGGVRGRVDMLAVNLAAKLADGQQVVVPLRGQGGPAAGAAGSAGGAGVAGGSAGGAGGGGGVSGPAAGAKISLSNATETQLEELDGVGPGLAGRIIEYRQVHGGFKSVDQLQEVSGFGPKRLQALRGSVVP